MTSLGTDSVSKKVLIIDLSDFENRKEEIAKQLDYGAKEVGFVRLQPPLSLRSIAARAAIALTSVGRDGPLL